MPAANFCVGVQPSSGKVPLGELVTMSTYFPSSHDITRKWFVLDANGKTLGRLATEAASMLAGKKNPKYTPFIDMGDHVIIVNAEKIVLTGLKSQQKVYRRYTGFPGGLREESFVRLWLAGRKRLSKTPSRACCRRAKWAARWGPSSRCTGAISTPTRHSSLKFWSWRRGNRALRRTKQRIGRTWQIWFSTTERGVAKRA